MSRPILKIEQLSKKFPHITALDSVSLEVYPGEVHALLGENGAGKTTLVNILYGLYQPDSGRIELEGKPVVIDSPKRARELGIVMLSQHPALMESMSVLENLAIWLKKRPSKSFRKEIEKKLAEWGLKIDLDVRVWQLSQSDKVRVELAKIILSDAKVYIFDEPTSAMGTRDRELVYKVVRRLRDLRKAIIYITHKIDEVFEIADRVTVLRRGRKVLTKPVSEVTRDELLYAMFGRVVNAVHDSFNSREHFCEPLLRIVDLTVRDDSGRVVVSNLNLTVNRGEIVGITGPIGQSKREILEVIAGLRKPERGKVILEGSIEISGLDPDKVRKLGVAYIPDDRLGLGVAPSLETIHNIMMRDLDLYTGKIGIIGRLYLVKASELLRRVGLPETVAKVPCAELSGGMIQRVIIARELFARKIKLVLAVNPTQGLDYETTLFIHSTLSELKREGVSTLMVSEDVSELTRLCDRVLVICNGEVKMELTRSEMSSEMLERIITG